MQKLYGIATALLTPFDEKGNLDEQSLKKHCDFLITAGVHCIYALGTTGEVFLMSHEERKHVAELIVNHVAGRIPVFIHVGAIPTKNACDLAKHAENIGADGIGAVTPYYYGISQAAIKEYYLEISKSIRDDYPLYLYNLPGFTTNDLLPETAKELAGVKNIVGLKNSMGDFSRIVSLLRTVPEDFDIVQGCDALLMSSLIYGAKASISGYSNIIPELLVKLYDSVAAKDYVAAKQYQEAVLKTMLLIKDNLAYFKEALHCRGIQKIYTRKPIPTVSAEEAKFIHREFDIILEENGIR